MKAIVRIEDHNNNPLLDNVNSKTALLRNNIIARKYSDLLKEYTAGSFGYGAISVLGQSCFASIAAMCILMNGNNISTPVQMLQLYLVTMCCLGFNAMVLSQRSPRIQVNVLITSVITSFVFLCSNVF